MTTKIALCDIDGCCNDCSARLPYFEAGDFARFVSLMHTDKPIAAGVLIYKALLDNPDIRVVFNTSRNENQRQATLTQLSTYFDMDPGEINLWMRPLGTHGTDCDVLKTEAIFLHGYTPRDVIIAFDDRPSVCKAYRDLGIIAYQTAEGW